MFDNRTSRAAGWICGLSVMVIVVAGCGSGATHTSMTADAVRPIVESAPASHPAAAAIPVPATQVHAPTTASTAAPAHTAVVATVATPAPKPITPVSTAPAPVSASPPETPSLPARTQPTAAEVDQVIAQVHALIPLFTPTAAQIAKVGNEVCTAFDQGESVAQIKSTAIQMAGVYAALLSPSVVNRAVTTIVTLYCPGYAAKLA